MQKKKNFGITKPSALLKKERELKELQEAKASVKGKIVKIKKKIQHFQDQLDDSRSAHEAKVNLRDNMMQMAQEVMDVVDEVQSKVKLTKKDLRDINDILENLGIHDIMETKFEIDEEKKNEAEEIDFSKYTDEFNRKRTEQIFDEFMVKPSTAEQQNLRKIFLQLAGRFHPDKAEGEEQAAQFHEMMQTINGAYDSGDLESLLALQAKYAEYTTADAYSSANDIPLTDAIQEQILRTRQEVEMLEAQFKRLKKEKLNLENSELGLFIQHYKDETKGMTAKERAEFSQTQELMFDMYMTFKLLLVEWCETQKRPQGFNLFVKGEHPLQLKIESMDVSRFSQEAPLTDEEMLEDIERMMQRMSKKQRQEVELMMAIMIAEQMEEEKRSRRNKKKR